MTKLFIAGATGAVGKQVVDILKSEDVDFIAHLRPRPGREEHELVKSARAAYLELSEIEKVAPYMKDCSCVLQLIGTIRKRFHTGDTYETSDIETTRQLVEAAKLADVKSFIILSSVGAGEPKGAYLKAKQRAEAIVTESGLNYSVIRPSAFMGDRHKLPPGTEAFMNMIGGIGFKRFADKYKPIRIEDLARIIINRATSKDLSKEILEGKTLWDNL